MKALTKKQKIGIGVVAGIVVVFVLLTTVGKPLFSKNITAEKLADFETVCHGNKVSNAAAYSDKKSAVITAFYEKPVSDDNPWTEALVGNAPNMAKFGEQTKVNVVACFDYQPFAGKVLATCDNGIKLKSATYKTIFYEAKTGKKISEGTDIVNDDSTCPSVYVYGKTSRETARQPDSEPMGKEITNFVQ